MTMTTADSPAVNDGWQVAAPQVQLVKEKVGEEKKESGSYDSAKQTENSGDEQIRKTQQSNVIDGDSAPLSKDVLIRLDEARILAKDDKILLAAHTLHGIDEVHLQPLHRDILREAAAFQDLLRDNTNTTSLEQNNNDEGWVKQGDHIGRHNFSIYYKMNNKTNELSCRLETIIHSDQLVPILSVLNESELYATWLPNYNVPRLKVVKSEKWRQTGRCSQVVNVETEVPWPLATRQVILKAVACDNIDSYSDSGENADKNECPGKHGGRIIIRLQSLDCQDSVDEQLNIPAVKKGSVRMKVNGGFTIEKCMDHPLSKTAAQSGSSSKEDLVLMTFSYTVDPELRVVPKSFVNFFLKVAMPSMWNMFLDVTDDVKGGVRPDHSNAINEKRELYDWIEERASVMLTRGK